MMISMHHRLEMRNDWLTWDVCCQQIAPSAKTKARSVKRCQFQEESHLPFLGHFWRVVEVAGQVNQVLVLHSSFSQEMIQYMSLVNKSHGVLTLDQMLFFESLELQ